MKNDATVGPLTGRRVRIRRGRLGGWGGALATLKSRYMHMGAYWARVEGRSWETVVWPKDWELV